MSKNLESLNVPNEWHRFLYRSVLLEWETSLSDRQNFARFSPRKPICGTELIKVDTLKDMEATVLRFGTPSTQVERLVFYSTETALKDLFRLLRNCVAHAHYSCPRRGWIEFHPEHIKGKIKLSGLVKFGTLKNLIASISS
jgi:hypothetical protein